MIFCAILNLQWSSKRHFWVHLLLIFWVSDPNWKTVKVSCLKVFDNGIHNNIPDDDYGIVDDNDDKDNYIIMKIMVMIMIMIMIMMTMLAIMIY